MSISLDESTKLEQYLSYVGPRITEEECLLVGVFMACGEDRIDLRPDWRVFYPTMIFHRPANCQLQRRFGWNVSEDGVGYISHDERLLLLYEVRLRYSVRTDCERDQIRLLQQITFAGANGCSRMEIQPICDEYYTLTDSNPLTTPLERL